MPEKVTVLLKEAKKIKEGTNAKGKPWRLFAAIDGNDEIVGTHFDSALNDRLVAVEGKKIELIGESDGDRFKIADFAILADEPGEQPKLGTGEYVKGQMAEADRRGICASTAANNAGQMAGDLLKFQTGREITLDLYKSTWDACYFHVFHQLLRSNGIMRDEDIPF